MIQCRRCGSEFASTIWDSDVCPRCSFAQTKAQERATQELDRSDPALDSPLDLARDQDYAPSPPSSRRGIWVVALVAAIAVGETLLGFRGIVLSISLALGLVVLVNAVSLLLAARLFLLEIEFRTAVIAVVAMGVVVGVLVAVGSVIHPVAAALGLMLGLLINIGILKNVLGCGTATAVFFAIVWGFVNLLGGKGFESLVAFLSGP